MQDTDRAKAIEVIGALPRRTTPEDAGLELVTDPQVGDVVWTYSRAQYRRVIITKVGPKRAEVVYTTQGAVEESQRIHASYLAADPAAMAAQPRKTEARNYAWVVRMADGTDEHYTRWAHITEDQKVADRAKYTAQLEAMGSLEDHLDRVAEGVRAGVEAHKAQARERGPLGWVHVTTKSVQRTDLWAEPQAAQLPGAVRMAKALEAEAAQDVEVVGATVELTEGMTIQDAMDLLGAFAE